MTAKKTVLHAVLALLLVLSITLPINALANSAEPPGLTVVVSFPPPNLSLSIRFADGSTTNAIPLIQSQKAWESYYRFFYSGMEPRPSFKGATLLVQSNENQFECPLPENATNRYNNLLTLNVGKQTVTVGQSTTRTILLIALRVLLTLLIEGLIFFAFGYRKKASWIAFFVINLITQGLLNALITGPLVNSYWVFEFAFYELVIFIVEMIAFALVLKEHKKRRAVAYALVANLASLVLGGMLISFLPI